MDEYLRYAFHESLGRCTRRDDFFETFRQRLVAVSEEASTAFARLDVYGQARMTKVPFYMILSASTGDGIALRRLGRFAQGTCFPARLYDHWLNALVEAVACADECFDAGVETAWRHTMKPGIEHIKALA